MDRPPQFKSIRTQLVFWLVFAAVVPLVIVGVVDYGERTRSIKAEAFAKLEAIRDLKVFEVENWLDERCGDIETIAGALAIRDFEQVWQKGERSAGDKALLANTRLLFQRYLRNYDAYSEILLINAHSGIVEVSTNESREGELRRNDPYLSEPLRSESTFVKDVYHCQTDRRLTMTFSTPVRCREHQGDHIVGVVVAKADLEHSLYRLLLNRVGMGQTGETLIVSRDVVALNTLRWHGEAPLKLKITAKPAVQATRGETNVAETSDYRGEMVLAAYTHIPKTNWGFVAKQDLAEVYAPIREMLRQRVLLLAGSMIVACVFAWLLGSNTARPVSRLKAAADQLHAGDMSARCDISRADELGSLGISLNSMADSLESHLAVRRGAAAISETTAQAQDLPSFSERLVQKLAQLTDSNVAAFYLRSRGGEGKLEHVASIGLKAEHLEAFDADNLEGEFGASLATRQISHIRSIPEDTRFSFKTVSGTAVPKEIVTIPLAPNGDVIAMISLGSLNCYSEAALEILDTSWRNLNATFANLVASEETKRLADEVHAANQELVATNEELQSQSEELRNQAAELKDQADELETQRTQVEEANRLKSEFLSNMSHELRTPLNSVMALSQLMLSRGPGKKPEQDTTYLRTIERNGQQLLSLINDILDLSKIEAGRVDFILSDFAPRSVAERALETVRPLAEEKGLSIEAEIQEAPLMHSDEERIGQILVNLFANAVKFTEEGGIKVGVSEAEAMVSFTVADTGIGIPKCKISDIFDEFRQVDGSTTRQHGGTGLGLAICQKLATLLGGEITVQSDPGKGSTFTLMMPTRCPDGVVLPDTAPADAPPAAGRAPTPPETERIILVVEDNEAAALQVTTALEESGYTVHVASDGSEAIEFVRRTVPSAIVLDLMMPGVDGFSVLNEVRATERTAEVPVLVLTAKELTIEERGRLRRNDVQQLVQKGSLAREELVHAVHNLFDAEPTQRAPEQAEKEPPQAATTRGHRTILVVEDNPDNLFAITEILDETGCDCLAAKSGGEAVKVASESAPSLILMDIELPGLDGIEATKLIKSDPALKDVPIIALTAKAMRGDRERILAAGCDDYLAKPLNPEEVVEAVKKWLMP